MGSGDQEENRGRQPTLLEVSQLCRKTGWIGLVPEAPDHQLRCEPCRASGSEDDAADGGIPLDPDPQTLRFQGIGKEQDLGRRGWVGRGRAHGPDTTEVQD